MDIDSDRIAALLRSVTDELGASFRRPAPDATLPELIGQIKTVNAWAEGLMRESLDRLYPDIGWSDADEEDGHTQGRPKSDAPYWVYDPVDAVYHTMQGLPLWSASLALVSGKQTVFGAVYDPTLGEMFMATRGGGATLNGAPLRPIGKSRVDTAIVATFLTPPYAHGDPARHELTLRLISAVSKKVFIVRAMASASLHLAYVAAGRLDAVFDVSSTPHDWLAGGLLVEEAGMAMTDLRGAPYDWAWDGIIAAAPALCAPLVEIVCGQLADAAPAA